jgi:hypothetical protein
MKKVILFVCLLLMMAVAPVYATTYNFVANSAYFGYGEFSLQYTDKDNDGLFSLDELINFSGVYLYAGSVWGWTTFTQLTRVPIYDSIKSPLTDGDYDGGYNGPIWLFTVPDSPAYAAVTAISWTPYTQTAVPLPPTALLLGTGILGLVGWRRIRKG